MTDETIFKDPAPAADQNAGQEPKTEEKESKVDYNAIFNDKLAGITNEKGEQKYSDVMTALEALKFTQEHIRTLENENKSLRENKIKAETIEEALSRLNKTTDTNQSTDKTEGKKEIDVEELARRIVREESEAMSKKAQAESNKASVSQALVKKFGDSEKASKAFEEKAKGLGVTKEFLTSMAETSPKAVLAYFDTVPATVNKNLESSVSTEITVGDPNKPKISGVMYGASTKDMMSAWNAAKEAVLSESN